MMVTRRWKSSTNPSINRAALRPSTVTITGGCLCGAVRYRAQGAPFRVSHCHCGMCRKLSGAAFLTFVAFKSDSLTWTVGKPARYRSSPAAERGFCSVCGSTLATFEDDLPDWAQVTVGSLDRPENVTPVDHVCTDSQLPWLHIEDGLPRHSRFSPEGGTQEPNP